MIHYDPSKVIEISNMHDVVVFIFQQFFLNVVFNSW